MIDHIVIATGQWFSQGTPVSSNKTDRHDITEILMKVALNTITLIQYYGWRHLYMKIKFLVRGCC